MPLRFKRSTKFEAARYAFASVAFVIIGSLALEFFVVAEANVKEWIQYAVYAVCVFVWVMFVIPNVLKTGFFELSVDQEQLKCSFPDGSDWSMRLDDIDRVEKRFRTTMSDTYVEYWVIGKDGQSHWVTPNYGLAPDTVLKALKRYLPDLEVVKKTTY